MVNDPRQADAAKSSAAGQGMAGRLAKLISWRNVALSVLVLGTLHTLLVYSLVVRPAKAAAKDEETGPECSLGTFRYLKAGEAGQRLPLLEFEVHVELLEGQEPRGRELLRGHRFKVQQGIEELLRQTRVDDFDDPKLSDLKHQVQETIYRAVGVRIVDEVLITNLAYIGPSESLPQALAARATDSSDARSAKVEAGIPTIEPAAEPPAKEPPSPQASP